MMKKIKGLFSEEQGQGMTEYGLILGLIALAVVAVLGLFGDELNTKFDALLKELQGDGTEGTTTP
ncbi:Flp family type IVb pilin [Bacillus sp. DNRA2]|uniref:Flp family type IVb pilin n=1 Tax=Bacillus sp. DNRA2 TaxID=2723053 RepID=UPI00145DF1CF|nr:Flp family type IVb pilin [Bacillus sp. DNRA2]NMD70116.1 Flp family type IVb pilin [Bacillus sp. DNRA2]